MDYTISPLPQTFSSSPHKSLETAREQAFLTKPKSLLLLIWIYLVFSLHLPTSIRVTINGPWWDLNKLLQFTKSLQAQKLLGAAEGRTHAQGTTRVSPANFAGGGGGGQFERGVISLARALISKKGTFWSAINEGAARRVLNLLNEWERQRKA